MQRGLERVLLASSCLQSRVVHRVALQVDGLGAHLHQFLSASSRCFRAAALGVRTVQLEDVTKSHPCGTPQSSLHQLRSFKRPRGPVLSDLEVPGLEGTVGSSGARSPGEGHALSGALRDVHLTKR